MEILWSLLSLLLLQLSYVATKHFRFAHSYGDHMVLQMAPAHARVWGYGVDGTVGTEVTLQLAGKKYTTTMQPGTGKGPKWQVDADPITNTGHGYDITVTNGGRSINITDVLFGDVWYCGGQSNMQHFLSRIINPGPEIDEAMKFPDIRTFALGLSSPKEPIEDFENVRQHWGRPDRHYTSIYSAVCWLFGKYLYQKLNRPIGLVQSAAADYRIQAWLSPDAVPTCITPGKRNIKNPGNPGTGLMWNGMVYPMLQMNMKGVIWYQGESNALNDNVDIYQSCLMGLISDWRMKFNRKGQTSDQPWGIVQLAPNRNDPGLTSGYTDVRWAQSFSYGFLPNPELQDAFLAVTIDYPDFFSPYGSMHPRFKRIVSARLAMGALAVVYGQQIGRIQGPIPTQYHLNGKSLDIVYDGNSAQLMTRSTVGFELCCSKSRSITCETVNSNASWTATTITTVKGATATVAVTCPDGQLITGIRYAWRESPCEFEKCALYSQDGELPAPPYIKHGIME